MPKHDCHVFGDAKQYMHTQSYNKDEIYQQTLKNKLVQRLKAPTNH